MQVVFYYLPTDALSISAGFSCNSYSLKKLSVLQKSCLVFIRCE